MKKEERQAITEQHTAMDNTGKTFAPRPQWRTSKRIARKDSSGERTPANVHDINYMKDIKFEFHDCSIFGDRAYISAELKQDLFSSVGIKLEVPYRLNMKDWKPTFKPFAKARKRIETNFSQLCDQFMIFRNYAKQTAGLFTRIIGKISAFTVLQYINYINERPIGRVKYALS